MPSVGSVARPEIVQATVDISGETVTVQFDRSQITLRWISQVKAARETEDAALLADCFAAVVSGWDITAEDGSPFPPTQENLAALPARVIGAIIESLQNAATPGEAEGKASAERSSTPPSASTLPPATPPNGQAASFSLEHSASQSLS